MSPTSVPSAKCSASCSSPRSQAACANSARAHDSGTRGSTQKSGGGRSMLPPPPHARVWVTLRLEDDLQALLLLVLEDLVAVRRLVERQAVRDDEAGVDLAALDAVQQRPHVALHVALAALDR